MAGIDIDGFDWDQCILCQEKTDEKVRCPISNTKKDDVERNYTDTTNLLGEFFKIRKLPQSFHSSLSDLIRHSNLSDIFLQKQAKWHRSCKSKITTSKLEKCQTSSTQRKKKQLADSPVQAKSYTKLHSCFRFKQMLHSWLFNGDLRTGSITRSNV